MKVQINLITVRQLDTVVDALLVTLKNKGALTRMSKVEEIEEAMLNIGVNEFVPVTMCLRKLVEAKFMRYFKKDSGQLVYGLTKMAIAQVEGNVELSIPAKVPAKTEEVIAPTQEELNCLPFCDQSGLTAEEIQLQTDLDIPLEFIL